MNNIIIAIDGPAGAGKSTISKLISKKMGINYIDTGAMYRAITLKCICSNIDVKDEKSVIEICKNSDVDFRDNSIYLDGINVDGKIRTNEVSSNVSYVAKIKEVREILVKKQREIGLKSSVILDGRDVGTHIFPDTKNKFYLNASAEMRGKRRYKELIKRGEHVSLNEVIKDVICRDEIDSNREFAPLVKADDAVEIDSTNMSIDEVVEYIISKVKS